MNLIEWNKPDSYKILNDDEIHVWLCDIDNNKTNIDSLKKMLSLTEQKKADKFHFKKDQNSFIVSHYYLRFILSQYLNCFLKDIIFDTNEYGKPFIKNNFDNTLSFNLSHSGKYCLIGITLKDKIGVDIEIINKDFSSLEIAEKYFSKKEYSELLYLKNTDKTKSFYYCWTRKEAYIKAEGKGLSIPLDSFDVTLAENNPKIIRINEDQNIIDWQLFNIPIEKNYCAAVAIHTIKKKKIKYYSSKILSNLKK